MLIPPAEPPVDLLDDPTGFLPLGGDRVVVETSIEAAPRLAAGELRIEHIESDSALAALECDWDALAADVPFRTWQWLECWWRHYHTRHDRLLVVAVRSADGELLGVAPWYVRHTLGRGRVVRFLGSGEVCSDYLTLVCRDAHADAVANAVGGWLMGPGAPEWDLLELTGVAKGEPALEALCRRLTAAGHPVHRQLGLNCWRVPLPNEWDKYLSGLSRTRRERTRTILKRSFAAGRAAQHTADEASLDRAFETLVDLHQRRWRSLGQQGCFGSRRFTAFHREVAARMLASGRLRLHWTEHDGKPIAAEYGLVGGRTIYFYQSGIDPEAADLRPGWMSVAASLRSAIAAGFEAFDFLRGNEPYKASWGAEPRPLVDIHIVARRHAARLRHAAWRASRAVKRCARRAVSAARSNAGDRGAGRQAPADGA